MSVLEEMSRVQHYYERALEQLYAVQDGNLSYPSEDYCKGLLNGLAIALGVFGLEFEEYDPFRREKKEE